MTRKYLAAIDIGGSHIKTVLATAGLEPVRISTIPVRPGEGMVALLREACAELRRLLAGSAVDDRDLLAVGISSFGFVDSASGRGIRSWRSDIAGVDIAGIVSGEFGVPSLVDNDGHVAVLGEHYFGAARGHEDVIHYVLGTGLATGVMLNGQVVSGYRNVAGEFSHFVMEATGGLRCICGRDGCAQAYISGDAMVAHARALLPTSAAGPLRDALERHGDALTAELITRSARQGDPVAVEVVDRFIQYLSVLVSSTMISLNPSIVLIGGGISRMGSQLLDPLRERVFARLMHERQRCPIELAELGQQSGAYGALVLAARAARIDVPDQIDLSSTPSTV